MQEYSRVTNSTDGKALLKVQGLYTDEWRMWAAIGCVPSSSLSGVPREYSAAFCWGPPGRPDLVYK